MASKVCDSPQSSLGRPREGDSGEPVNPELQNRTACPPGLKKNQRNRWNMGRGFVLGLWIRASWWHKATPQLWRGREAGKFQKVIGWLTALDDPMRFRFLPVSMKRSRRKGREQGGRGVVKIMARDVQNFQSIKEKYVKKVDSRPEQSPCSRVLTARGLDLSRSKNGY